MATMNVSLPDPMRQWVEEQVSTGHYSNSSDYVRDLIRKDQQYYHERQALIDALKAGEQSGISNRTVESVWQDVKKRRGKNL